MCQATLIENNVANDDRSERVWNGKRAENRIFWSDISCDESWKSSGKLFCDDKDRLVFLKTLEESCEALGWKVHSFVLMRNLIIC